MNNTIKILIGGRALVALGSNRNTTDTDYLICDKSNPNAFITSENTDYLNAGSKTFVGKFFNEIYKKEINNQIASPASLLELKAFALVQHYQNGKIQKALDCETDIKFLVSTFSVGFPTIVKKYISQGEYAEVCKIMNEVNNRNF